MMADDPTLREAVDDARRTAAATPPHAIDAALAEHRDAFAARGRLPRRAGRRPRRPPRPRRRRVPGPADARAARPRPPVRPGRRATSPPPTPQPRPGTVLALVTERGRPDQPHRDPGPRPSACPPWSRCAGVARRGRRRRWSPSTAPPAPWRPASPRTTAADVQRASGRGARAPRRDQRPRADRRRPPGRAAGQHRLAPRDLPAGRRSRASACSAPSCSSWTAATRRRSRSRSPPTREVFAALPGRQGRRPHPRRGRRQAAAVPAPAPTSPTRRSASAACGWPARSPSVLDTQLDAIAQAAARDRRRRRG